MHQFTFNDNRFTEIQKRALLRLIPLTVIVVPISFLTGYFQTGMVQVDAKSAVPAFIILTVLVASGISKLKKMRIALNTIRITISENSITRTMQGLPELTIPFADITQIVKLPNGDLQVKTARKYNTIGIHAQMNDYNGLVEILNTIHPITESKTQNLLQKYGFILSIITILLMYVVFFSNNKTWVLISGAPLVILLCVSLYIIQKSPNIEAKIKRLSWIGLLPLLSIIVIMYMKLTA